jgi:hypothetical protein
MATYTASAAHAASGVQPKGTRVGLVAVAAVYSLPSSISIGTVVQMIKVPAGATPLYVAVGNTNIGQATLSVGDGLNNARYKADATFSAAQGMALLTPAAETYTYSQDDTIDIFISLVSITSAGGALYLRAIYSMDV